MVQRVLGREDQRKQCCGQMETLQTLRDVKAQVKDEEDDFIAEVLSVPLSTRDLQRQTEKELQHWQNERPSSTFDPRGRCLGYHMAWMRSRQSNEECERKEKEKGNLAIPLSRSASSLSLSVSKWQKGVKERSGNRKSNVKVVRHFSMGAKEDCRHWANLSDKKGESLQDDDFVLKEKNRRSDLRLKRETQQMELLEVSEQQQTEAQDVPQVTVHLQTEQMKEKSQSFTDTVSQEENSESKFAPIINDFKAIKQRETQLSAVTTDKHIQLRVELLGVNNLYQVKSLKQLATQASRCPDFNNENNERHLNSLGKTCKQNNGADKFPGKLSVSGGCHFYESLTETKIKESHTQSDLKVCESAAQEQIETTTRSSSEHVNIGAMQMQAHLPISGKKKCMLDCSDDIQATCQYVTAEEGTMISQTTADSHNSTKNYDRIIQSAPVKETQSNVCETNKNYSKFQQIEYDFRNTNQQYSFKSPGDFCVRKSSSARELRLTRKLSEDLFTTPQILDKTITNYSSQVEQDEAAQILKSQETEEAVTQKDQQPRHFVLFRKLREEKKNKKQRKSKMKVPKIMIQDFSDDREIGQVDIKVTSQEKRRPRKEQKRKEKESKKEKEEKEKEEEEKRSQAKDTRVHEEGETAKQVLGSAASPSVHETSYAEVYF